MQLLLGLAWLDCDLHFYKCFRFDICFCPSCFDKSSCDGKHKKSPVALVSVKKIAAYHLSLRGKWTIATLAAPLVSFTSSALSTFPRLLTGDVLNSVRQVDMPLMALKSGLMSLLGLILSIFGEFKQFVQSSVRSKRQKLVRERLFYVTTYQEVDFFEERGKENMARIVDQGPSTMEISWRVISTELLDGIALLAAWLFASCTVSWKLSLLVMVLLLLFLRIQSVCKQSIRRAEIGAGRWSRHAHYAALELFRHIRIVRSLSTEDVHLNLYSYRTSIYAKREHELAHLKSYLSFVEELSPWLLRSNLSYLWMFYTPRKR